MALLAISGVFAAVLALAVGHFALPLGRALGLLDHPDKDGGRKRHARTTPLVGGFALAGATVFAALLNWHFGGGVGAGALLWLALAVAAMFMLGVIDDRNHISPPKRLAAAIIVLTLLVFNVPAYNLSMLHFSGQNMPLHLGWWGVPFTILCLVGLLNAVNMADGKDGVVIGMGLIWAVVLAIVAPAQWPVLAAAFVALAIMLRYNMARKLFLGDGGSYALSTLFGLMGIAAYNGSGGAVPAELVALLFAVPVFDTVRLMLARRLAGRSPFDGDRDHLHHHLHARIGWPTGLFIYLAMVGLPIAGALVWPASGLLWLLVSLLVYIGVIVMTRFANPARRPAE